MKEDIKKRFYDILFVTDDEEEEEETVVEAPLEDLNKKKETPVTPSATIKAQDILYKKPKSTAFVNLDDVDIRKPIIETFEVKKENEYIPARNLSPIFGIIDEKDNEPIKTETQPAKPAVKAENDSYLKTVISPFYGNDIKNDFSNTMNLTINKIVEAEDGFDYFLKDREEVKPEIKEEPVKEEVKIEYEEPELFFEEPVKEEPKEEPSFPEEERNEEPVFNFEEEKEEAVPSYKETVEEEYREEPLSENEEEVPSFSFENTETPEEEAPRYEEAVSVEEKKESYEDLLREVRQSMEESRDESGYEPDPVYEDEPEETKEEVSEEKQEESPIKKLDDKNEDFIPAYQSPFYDDQVEEFHFGNTEEIDLFEDLFNEDKD